MHTTHSNTQYKNESKHSEMGPVRQNPTQSDHDRPTHRQTDGQTMLLHQHQ